MPWANVEPSRRPLRALLRSWGFEPKPRQPRKVDSVAGHPYRAEEAPDPLQGYALQLVYGPACIDQPAFPLSPAQWLRVGRDQHAPNLRIEDKAISRCHATIHWDRDIQSFKILDDGSHNGVYVNGMRVTAAPLQPDDVIRIGQSLLLFRATPTVLESRERSAHSDTAIALLALLGTFARAPQQQLTADAAEALLIGQFHSNSQSAERVLRGLDAQRSAGASMDLSALSRVEPQLVSDLSDARDGQMPPKKGGRRRAFRRWLSWLAPK